MATFGERLAHLRGDLSQEKLAERLGQKRPSTVQGWEKGRLGTPKPKMLPKIAAALGVDVPTLMLGVVTDYDKLRGYNEELLLAISNADVAHIAIVARRLADAGQIDNLLRTVNAISGVQPPAGLARESRRVRPRVGNTKRQ